MSNVDLANPIGKADVFERVEGADTVLTQAVAVVDPTTGTPLPFATEQTLEALRLAAIVIQNAAESLNTKTTAVNTSAIAGNVSVSNFPATQSVSGTVAIDSASLTALENINANVSGTVALDSTTLNALETINANTGCLTNAELRASAVPVAGIVSIDNLPSTQTVAGTVALDSASLNALENINVASSALPTGAATESTLSTISSYFKAEDTTAISGDYGMPALCMRQVADTTSTDADGDYTLLKIDEEGRLKVATKPASFSLVTGNITANGQSVFCDVSRASNVMISVVATSLVGHNATFEGSIDSTNGTDGNWFGIQVIRSNANTIELVSGVLAATPAYAWEASVNGLSFIRVRATAHTSGTATWKFQRGSYATEPIPAAQISGTQPVSGTVTANLGTFTSPTNASIINSAASTNGTVIKASAGNIYNITASNSGASTAFVKLHNSTTVTPGTTAVAMIIPVPTNSVVNIPFGALGSRFATGICLSITGAIGDTDTTAVAAGQVKVVTSFI